MADKPHPAVTQYMQGLQALLTSVRNDNDVAGGLWSQLKDAHLQFFHDNMLKRVDDDDDESTRVSEPPKVTEDTNKKQNKQTELKRTQKHIDAANNISVLRGKQRTLLSKELYIYVKDIEKANKNIENVKKLDEKKIDDCTKQMAIDGNENRITHCNVQIEALRDRFCSFEDLIADQEENLDDAFRNDVLEDCRSVTPVNISTGQVYSSQEFSMEENNFKIVPYMKEWIKYYREKWNKDKDDADEPDERPSKRARTGTPREFEVGDHVMVKYPDKWHHAIVTNYFSTSQAKGNRKIKAGYVVDFIATNQWENGLQPKKGKKMRSPDEEEEELFADVDAAAIVEEVKDRFAT